MFGYTLQDHERASLSAPCHRWVDHLSDDETKALPTAIWDAFKNWQLRQADPQGRVKVVNGWTGLLSLPMTEALVPHGDVEPWQCAGPFVKNDIDLAFKLWLEDDPDFVALNKVCSLYEVFSIIGLWSARTAAPDSLIRLNGFLVGALIDELDRHSRFGKHLFEKLNDKTQREKANLAKGRLIAQQDKKRKGDELHQSLRTAAFDYLLARPPANNDELIPFLRDHRFQSLKASTIARLIAGVRQEVKLRLKSATGPRTDLYATGQKSRA